MKEYYLLALYSDGECTVIGLHPRTLREAYQALSWQKQGFPDGEYIIVKRYTEDCFRCIKSGNTYKASKGAYTDKAWIKFIHNYREKENPLLEELDDV